MPSTDTAIVRVNNVKDGVFSNLNAKPEVIRFEELTDKPPVRNVLMSFVLIPLLSRIQRQLQICLLVIKIQWMKWK